VLKKNITKKDLIKKINFKKGYSFNFSKKLCDDLIIIIIKNIKNGYLNIKNFGSFKIIYKNERIGRNPKTNEEFKISARNSLSFNASKKLTKELNNLK